MINWANFISQCFNGLVLGALLALIASGLTIIYGTLGVLNLAHGAMFMLGGYAGWVAYSYTNSFIAAVIAGEIHYSFLNAATVTPQIKGGRMKGFVTTAKQRLPELPDVPTLAQAWQRAQEGVPGPVFIEIPIDLLYDEATVKKWYGADRGGKSLADRAVKLYLRRHVNRRRREF